MFDPSTLWWFVAASLLLIVAPGPDILFLVAQGARRGARAGLITALGLAAGNLVHTLGAALGISVVFQTSVLAFNSLKYAGAAYLLFLAWKILRAPHAARAAASVGETRESLFWRGFLMNVLNPKVALFFLAFLPQFVSARVGPVWLQMMFHGLLFTVLVACVFGTIGLFAGKLGVWLTRGGRSARHARDLNSGRRACARNPGERLTRSMNIMVAAVFVLLALRLATTQR